MKRIDVEDSFATGRPGAGYRSNYHFTRLYVLPIFVPIDHNILAELTVHQIDRTEKFRHRIKISLIRKLLTRFAYFCFIYSDTD